MLENMWGVFSDSFPALFRGLALTLKLSAASLSLGVLIGLIVAFMRISEVRLLNCLANVYLTVVRGTPLIVQIAVLYFGITELVVLSSFWAGSWALAFHNGAYIAEIFRGAIQSIGRGQMEASRSLGMSYALAMRRIILPQALKRAIPPLGNQFIIGLKDSSLVFFIGLNELWGTGQRLVANNWLQFETYMVVALFYLAMVMFFSWLVHKTEQKLDVDNSLEGSKI